MTAYEKYNENNRLQELGGSNFKIAEGEPNIKGWTVKDPQGRTIGEVDELLFDPQTRKVRYIVLDLEGNILDLEPRNVLVPIGLAELHESDDDVILPNVTAAQLQALPVYETGKLSRDIESSIRNVFAGIGAAASATGAALTGKRSDSPDDFYTHEYYDEDKLFRLRSTPPPAGSQAGSALPPTNENLQAGTGQIEAGGVPPRTRIVERPAEGQTNLGEEQLHGTRPPVNLAGSEEEKRDETTRGSGWNTDRDTDRLDPDDPRRNKDL